MCISYFLHMKKIFLEALSMRRKKNSRVFTDTDIAYFCEGLVIELEPL